MRIKDCFDSIKCAYVDALGFDDTTTIEFLAPKECLNQFFPNGEYSVESFDGGDDFTEPIYILIQ